MENKIVNRIQEEFKRNPDLTTKKIKLSLLDTVYVIYLETISSSDKVNDYILKNLSNLSGLKSKKIRNKAAEKIQKISHLRKVIKLK